jgi:hypothetical protein
MRFIFKLLPSRVDREALQRHLHTTPMPGRAAMKAKTTPAARSQTGCSGGQANPLPPGPPGVVGPDQHLHYHLARRGQVAGRTISGMANGRPQHGCRKRTPCLSPRPQALR